MNEALALAALGALAHPLRLKVFRALVVVGAPGLTAGSIQGGVGVPAASLSFHLKELSAASLVSQERSGRHIVYRADYARMNALLAYLTENCCQGAPCGVPCCEDPVAAALVCATGSTGGSMPKGVASPDHPRGRRAVASLSPSEETR